MLFFCRLRLHSCAREDGECGCGRLPCRGHYGQDRVYGLGFLPKLGKLLHELAARHRPETIPARILAENI